MTARRPQRESTGAVALVASLVAVLVAGVLLPWGLAEAGIRWSTGQGVLVTGATVVVAVLVLGRYARRIGGIGHKRVRVAMITLAALVFAGATLVALRVRVDQMRGELRDATMTASADGRVLRIEGFIADDFLSDLQVHLARMPDLRRIDIDSSGGLVEDALLAGDTIRRRSLRVRVVGQCASACVLLWASAPARELDVAARVGVHRTWIDGSVPEAWQHRVRGAYEARSLDALRAAGFSQTLLDRRADTASGDMAVFDAVDLLDHGVRMIVVDADGTPLTPRRVRELLRRP